MPNLVWTAGRIAEAIRTAAVACLCSALQANPQEDIIPERGAEGDQDKVSFFLLSLIVKFVFK